MEGPEETVAAATGSTTGRVSSPTSTGGAGTFFEQHVDTFWLALLLVRGIPPILRDCQVQEVHLQTERLGWNTDDFLIIGQTGAGDRRKLVGQVKRTFTVSASNQECSKAVQDFWKDFQNVQLFSKSTDRFALVTLRGTNVLLQHFAGLLDCARAARDPNEFEQRLATPGFIHARAVGYCDELRTIVSELEGTSVSAADLWPFLRVLYVLSLDLNTGTAQTEAVIKSLLAHTATGDEDAPGAAEASWHALLAAAGEGMQDARTFRYQDLPEAVRTRHSPIGASEQRILRALLDHSTPILDGICSTVGGRIHLGRGRLVQRVVERLQASPIVLISGAAGAGKSVVAKDVETVLAADHFTFTFRAEEFAEPHLDKVLHSGQIPANAAWLGAVLAGQDRKVLLVESVERLLEASTRDAFSDLLKLVEKDRSWQLVLTCRDYSADLVRACFLGGIGCENSVVAIPPLDDEELAEVEAAHPMLQVPLASRALRGLLRNPYVLDKALRISWSGGSEEQSLPRNEQEFRALFWKEIIRAGHQAAGGLPRRREDAFVQIALRRARALTLYAGCDDLDPAVVDALRRDSLIVSSERSDRLLAPAHDVLEDWAILHWIAQQHAMHENSLRELSEAVGTHPAVRRTYRQWVTELVEREPGVADELFAEAVGDGELPAHFRDDTLVSLLRSPSVASLLRKHRSEIFANNQQVLRRIIHLARVACVSAPDSDVADSPLSLSSSPDGPVWACILALIQENLDSFVANDWPLLLQFVEDWAKAVSWQTPYPDGFKLAAAIAHFLLPQFDDYRWEEQRKRTLKVVLKIPKADDERFAALLRRIGNEQAGDCIARDLQEMVFDDLDGWPAARDMPDELVLASNRHLLCLDAGMQQERGYITASEMEILFGLDEARGLDSSSASAYCGPFLALLRHHLHQGLDFVISVLNHAMDSYARPRVRLEFVEVPDEITLMFSDGTSRIQWCSARLWNLYRGTSVGPCALQSLLMATEQVLLELAEENPTIVDEILLDLLRRSNSVALTAVAASIATAYTHLCGETLLVLLGSPECILLDNKRCGHEWQAPSRIGANSPTFDVKDEIYTRERKEADGLPHRHRTLVRAIFELQLGERAPRAHEILDRHLAAMPPAEGQEEYHQEWRLALQCMDSRARKATAVTAADGRQYIRFDLVVPDPDIKETIDQAAVDLQAMEARASLDTWGRKVFHHEENAAHDPSRWRWRLQEARSMIGSEERDLWQGGPGFVAAVCVRDHWDEMAMDEQDWCVDVVCTEVERDGDCWEHTRIQRSPLSADQPCSWVLPLLLAMPLRTELESRVRTSFTIALTHAIDAVRDYAATGIGHHLWGNHPELAMLCVNKIAMEAISVQRAHDALIPPSSYQPGHMQRIRQEAASSIRQQFFESNAIADDIYSQCDANRWYEVEASKRILTILGRVPTDPRAITAFERLAHTIVGWWDEEEHRRRDYNPLRPRRNYRSESVLKELLQSFLLRVAAESARKIVQPILDAVDRHPQNAGQVLRGLIAAEARQPNTRQFWSLWALFAERVRSAEWLPEIDREHSRGRDMISTIFLGARWKKEVRHWRSLEGHVDHIHALFEDLPPCSTILESYLHFLYSIGEQSLPAAFVRIARRLRQGNPRSMMRSSNTVFMLESMLQRYVYGKPLELKRRQELQQAVLYLLDQLIALGSSAAFRMRDDFVTPMSASEQM